MSWIKKKKKTCSDLFVLVCLDKLYVRLRPIDHYFIMTSTKLKIKYLFFYFSFTESRRTTSNIRFFLFFFFYWYFFFFFYFIHLLYRYKCYISSVLDRLWLCHSNVPIRLHWLESHGNFRTRSPLEYLAKKDRDVTRFHQVGFILFFFF